MNGEGSSPPGLDLAALQAYLADAAPGLLDGELRAELIAGGKSNLTYFVSNRERTVVVRRPPLGHVLATAHDMSREHRVISALADTDVPVPAAYALCEDTEVIGAPFYVMERSLGRAYARAVDLEPLGPELTGAISERLVDTLVALHAVDPDAVGLTDFGRPQGFLGRQVRRWGTQLDASRSRDLPDADALLTALAAHVPDEQPGTIVHGDFRLDNALVDDQGRVTAVLDWEMSTLGDPLTDLGTMLVYQHLAALAPDSLSDAPLAPGYLSPDDLRDRYAAQSGRNLSDLPFYLALAFFKLGVILEGIHYRFLQGQTVGEGFGHLGQFTPMLFQGGLEALDTRR